MKKIFKDCIGYYNELNQLHRDEDLPAIVFNTGTKLWYQNGKLHRDEDMPAVDYVDGTKYWYQNGKRHRENDPACEYANGDKFWYYQGEKMNCSSTEEFIRLIKLRTFW